MGSPGPRRQAREGALQVLYAADLTDSLSVERVAHGFDEIVHEFTLPARARERARALVLGVAEHRHRLDEAIQDACTHWQIHRIGNVDRNILRIAAYELLVERETPAPVVIDEAVEIARRFAGEASPSFVNGVLDVVAKAGESALG